MSKPTSSAEGIRALEQARHFLSRGERTFAKFYAVKACHRFGVATPATRALNADEALALAESGAPS